MCHFLSGVIPNVSEESAVALRLKGVKADSSLTFGMTPEGFLLSGNFPGQPCAFTG
jgi:hypothetical protein